MRKLILDLNALDVQSFEPTPQPGLTRGTVRGHGTDPMDCTAFGTMCPSYCNEASTCQVSDLGTCVVSCGSCGPSCAGGYSCVTCDVACWEES